MLAPYFRNCLVHALLRSPRRATWGTILRKPVCIFKVDGFGDFILALGVTHLLLRHWGEENCVIVVYIGLFDLAQREFPRAKIIGVSSNESGWRNLIKLYPKDFKNLDRFEFDLIISLRHQRFLLHNLFLSRLRSNDSIALKNSVETGFENPFEHPFTTLVSNSPTHSKTCVEIERHRELARNILKRDVTLEEIVPTFSSIKATDGDYLVVTPFSSKTIKDYPSERLLLVLEEVATKKEIPIYLCGGSAERARLDKLLSTAQERGVPNIFVQQSRSFTDFCRFVAGSKAVLTMDTATAHLAIAFDKPTVVIIGGGHFGQFGPWQVSAKQIWLSNQLPCFGCNWQCIFTHPLCITDIPAEQVTNALLQKMQS